MKSVVINLSLFKFAWLAVVFSAAAGLAEVGAATVALVALVHLVRATSVSNELALLLIAGGLGLAWETLLLQSGLLSYPTAVSNGALAPYWIVAMWVLFATTLNVGMKWLHRNLFLAAAAGAIFGPLSFVAGQQAGAVSLADNAIMVLAVGWAVLLPLVTLIARSFNGYEDKRAPSAQAAGVA